MIMNRFKLLILLAISAAALAACTTSPTGRGQLVLKSDAQLAQEGARQFHMIREQAPLVKDRATIDYVACVANAIVEVLDSDEEEMYWELAIVDQPTINASVLPGGKIVTYAGILIPAKNQHQLAAVLGHEVAHVTAHHANERMSRAMLTDVGVDIASILAGGGYYRQTQAAGGALSTGATLGIMYPHTRLQESEADIVGLHYMARAGFDPRESVELWQNMGKENETVVPEYMSTHPSGETRIEQLVAELPTALALYNTAQAEGRYPDCRL
jgi:predicted Zn-dependent protease